MSVPPPAHRGLKTVSWTYRDVRPPSTQRTENCVMDISRCPPPAHRGLKTVSWTYRDVPPSTQRTENCVMDISTCPSPPQHTED
ncbi:hypothetical protein RRG08_019840 [Elysia crispata]|uniref:Uncharacterized protein n=1 Tax=Elysia crispata TaxID=231223 RepID=A0AAE0ZVV5_9GAST|nr:hypothetical protein RRG08_019840 [Elysia crispata]